MVKTRVSGDWDNGAGSFVHLMHKFVHSNIDVFPMYFISNNIQMKNIWYRVINVPRVCVCVQDLVAMDVTNSIAEGNVSTPVGENEFNNLKGKVLMLQSLNDEQVKLNILLKQRLDNQQFQIDNLLTRCQYLQPWPLPTTEPGIPAVCPLPALEPVSESLIPYKFTHNPYEIRLIETPVQPALDVQLNMEPDELPVQPDLDVELNMEPVEPPLPPTPATATTCPTPLMGLVQTTSRAIVPTNKPYTKQEDCILVEFVKNNIKHEGKAIWKNLESTGLLPGRTHDSLRNRYLLHIRRKLHMN